MTNMTIQQLLLTATMLAAALLTPHARAADPEVSLTMRSPQDNRLRDGGLIGSIRVTYREPHTEFQVWLEAEKSATAADRYVLTGKNDARNNLKIRLTGEGWTANANDGQSGLTRQTTDEQVSVNIVVDGNQETAPDEYVITANAVAIVP
ncbi:hypothetical protein BTJ39_17285 [Izhakiella australiensis]|uniref:Invasin n=1 Tax=Izhakiella australiensis TaxID=1926881 RepID=A0A1S8YIS0_9GAMM|nr:AfaD family invasin [Izhakiella australiensis]OON38613.1 hypothetical protein BTJ39_17285 [Izhakiella australiensis]